MKWHCSWRRLAASAAFAAVAAPAWALDPYFVEVDLNQDQTVDFQKGYSSLEDAIDALNLSTLLGAGYDGQQNFDVGFYLRGLDALVAFPVSGSGQLDFYVNGVGFNSGQDHITFTPRNQAASAVDQRKDTLDQLKDYLKKNRPALKSILTAFAAQSPIDPLAGNPDSLFGQRMRADFNWGFTNKVSQIWGCNSSAFNFTNDAPIQVAAAGGLSDIFADAQARAAALQAENEVGLGLLASESTVKAEASTVTFSNGTTKSFPGGTMATTALTLPFSYTVKLDSDPRKKIRIEVPLTYVTTETAASYAVGLDLAYSHPLSDSWSLTPAVGINAEGSPDLGSAGGVNSYSLTSAYTWRLDSLALSMGNAIGRYQSVGLKIGDYEAEADVNNTVFTNGFMLTGPNSLLARNMVVEYSVVDTRITGDTVYADAYDEIGVAIGHISTEMGIITSYTKFGLSYLIATGGPENINSVRLALTSRF